MDRATLTRTVRERWDDSVLPSLSELVAIPAVSSGFDPDWQAAGHLTAAVEHVQKWLGGRAIPGAKTEVVQLPGRTPVLLVDVPATEGAERAGTVLLYGHLDKQPPVGGWSEGLGPWTPVIRGGRLYGRGSADDGYAGYAATTAIEAVRAAGGRHARCVILLETGEESGSPDLPAYLDHLRDRLGEVSLVVCLDSGGNDYRSLWLTTSLRGLVQVDVTVRVLESGYHSGLASGIVPSSFRVLRRLLDRLEDSATGEIRLPELTVDIPEDRLAEVRDAVAAAPGALDGTFPTLPGTRLVTDDEVELTLNATWRPTLSVTGADGLPAPSEAGNVLRPFTTLCLSFRLPPTVDSARALHAVRAALTTDVPYGAHVELGRIEAADGWNAPALAPWLRGALDEASERVFGAPWRALGLGGSIPFMGLLQRAYPAAQFLVTGALGPGSNAHVPDESLDLGYATKVTEAVAVVLDAHARA
ncbi:M20/M25/M40 family metallo-hydrolase [Gandjariella thermophila]|uniref:Peptidase M20 n=1 Tax=Gandjariella thermophila TaxID=1931992 RepID=A0A4D4J8M2_9PSEU|nr:peptidase M20 [Gandjariella thermophila]